MRSAAAASVCAATDPPSGACDGRRCGWSAPERRTAVERGIAGFGAFSIGSAARASISNRHRQCAARSVWWRFAASSRPFWHSVSRSDPLLPRVGPLPCRLPQTPGKGTWRSRRQFGMRSPLPLRVPARTFCARYGRPTAALRKSVPTSLPLQ